VFFAVESGSSPAAAAFSRAGMSEGTSFRHDHLHESNDPGTHHEAVGHIMLRGVDVRQRQGVSADQKVRTWSTPPYCRSRRRRLPTSKRVAIIEWDSLEQAQAYVNSAAWKNLAPQRDKAEKIIRTYVVEATN
jgi:hypothetical protein